MDFTTICSEARRYVKANSTSYPVADLTESANNALNRVVTLIREAEGRWQWDDSNNTDYPIATAALTEDQQDYPLDSTHYEMERVEAKDEAGNWYKLRPIDQADLYDASLTDFLSTSGIPQFYDKIGRSLFLYPKPSYTQAASLKVWYKRGPSYFTTSDTTKTAGFNRLFHKLIPLWAAYDYAFANQLKVKGDLQNEIVILEDQLKEHYSHRGDDEAIRLRPRVINAR